MSIEKKVTVNTIYTRSINLERDANSEALLNSYILTSRGIETLRKISAALLANECPRSWSLVGPYGSGKSSFALFLSHLLGFSNEDDIQLSIRKVSSEDSVLADSFTALIKDSAGYLQILLTGSPDSLSKRIITALANKAKHIWGKKRGRTPEIVTKLIGLSARDGSPKVSVILECISELQTSLSQLGYKGILFVIDELGKFLEYEARHFGANDIYLLQAIAEHAYKDHDVKLCLVTLMHQEFEHYAKGLNKTLRDEWIKVQGRFESIPFLESTEQTIRVVSTAIEHNLSEAEHQKINAATKNLAEHLATCGVLPNSLCTEAASELFSQCYPLHPLTLFILPILCQKVAQNERTLFSYLGSKESFGFKEAISRANKIGDWIYPWEIFEYFVANQSSSIYDHKTHRRWAEVITAIERLGDAPPDEVNLLKTIGLMNIIGVQGGLKASKEIIELSLSTKSSVDIAIKSLSKKSIIQYRKFSSEYRVWQGSDFDIEQRQQIEIEKLGRLDLSECLNNRHTLTPIVARKFTIEHGSLRYFKPMFVDVGNIGKLQKNNSEARIVFFLAETKNDAQAFSKYLKKNESELDVFVLCMNSEQMREAVTETLALEEIQRSAQELNSDPVAQREFRDYYFAALSRESKLLERFVAEPQSYHWYWNNRKQTVISKRSLQVTLSNILQRVYCKSPIFKNELINRTKPSSQANAARNKLAMAMFNNEYLPELGIEKFPPEKAIYLSCLKETKLHVKGKNNEWYFQGPKSSNKKHDPCNIYPVWNRIDGFLDSTEREAKSLIELNHELMAPPYGVKAGMLPILYLAVLMANKQELAIFENKVYFPYLSEEQIERFLKRPDDFTVQRFRISGLNRSIHQVYANTLFNDKKERTLLELARPIAKMVLNLPVYTQITHEGLSTKAQAVRNTFKLSKSPVKLMLEDLPNALGVDLVKAKTSESELRKLSQGLIESLKELQHCLPTLKNQFAKMLAVAFGHEKELSTEELQKSICGRCKGLEDYTIDKDGLKAFLLRAQKMIAPEIWLDELLTFLGQKNINNWGDADKSAAEYRLIELTRKLSELEKLRLHYQKSSADFSGDLDIYLLRSVKKGAPDYDEVVAIDQNKHKAIKATKNEISSLLSKLDHSLITAVLAEIVDEHMSQKNNLTQETSAKISNTIKVVN